MKRADSRIVVGYLLFGNYRFLPANYDFWFNVVFMMAVMLSL
ncbi:hypothetical protein B194_0081 [Serratia plymuthica A30]|nr:hypothetical protein B194_0081 [Serratia plymuthica A30]